MILPRRTEFDQNELAQATTPVYPMSNRTLVPDAGEVVLYELRLDGKSRLIMVLYSVGRESCCPKCGRPSRRVHSQYKRQLADLPWVGIPVRIELRGPPLLLHCRRLRTTHLHGTLPNTVGFTQCAEDPKLNYRNQTCVYAIVEIKTAQRSYPFMVEVKNVRHLATISLTK